MSIVPSAADIEQKYEYWIELGRAAEQKRIVTLLQDLEKSGGRFSGYLDSPITELVAVIEGRSPFPSAEVEQVGQLLSTLIKGKNT
jgi:hypothetical protein